MHGMDACHAVALRRITVAINVHTHMRCPIKTAGHHTKPGPRFPFVLTRPLDPPSHSGVTLSIKYFFVCDPFGSSTRWF